MIFEWDTSYKDWFCGGCGNFLDDTDFLDGECPTCETDEHIHPNEKLYEEDEDE